MSIKLKNIQGLMLERKTDTLHSLNLEYNKALRDQGEVEIELDIEETAKVIYHHSIVLSLPYCRKCAEAINANLPRLLRVKKG